MFDKIFAENERNWTGEHPYAPWNPLMQGMFNSAIHKAAVQPAAIQNVLWRLFLLSAPIHSLWDIFQWNSEMVE